MNVVVALLLAAACWKLLSIIFHAVAFVFLVLAVACLFAVIVICCVALWQGEADPDARSSRKDD